MQIGRSRSVMASTTVTQPSVSRAKTRGVKPITSLAAIEALMTMAVVVEEEIAYCRRAASDANRVAHGHLARATALEMKRAELRNATASAERARSRRAVAAMAEAA